MTLWVTGRERASAHTQHNREPTQAPHVWCPCAYTHWHTHKKNTQSHIQMYSDKKWSRSRVFFLGGGWTSRLLVSIVFVILMSFCMILTCANKTVNSEPADLGRLKKGVDARLNYCRYLCLCVFMHRGKHCSCGEDVWWRIWDSHSLTTWLKLPALLSLTHGLLSHSALVCVPGRLVVVGVGNETSTHTEQREGLDLQVCCVSLEKKKKEQTKQEMTPGFFDDISRSEKPFSIS